MTHAQIACAKTKDATFNIMQTSEGREFKWLSASDPLMIKWKIFNWILGRELCSLGISSYQILDSLALPKTLSLSSVRYNRFGQIECQENIL